MAQAHVGRQRAGGQLDDEGRAGAHAGVLPARDAARAPAEALERKPDKLGVRARDLRTAGLWEVDEAERLVVIVADLAHAGPAPDTQLLLVRDEHSAGAGTRPWSEPETRAIRDLVLRERPAHSHYYDLVVHRSASVVTTAS